MKNLKRTALLLAISLSALLVAGCGVTPNQITAANELCKEHEGVSLIWATIMNSSVSVVCVDGTGIEMEFPDRN